MYINVTLTGKSPLVMHNVRLADPDDEHVRAIKEITSKGVNQTDADRIELATLEWAGGLYEKDGKVVVPSRNILRCLREAAAITRQGKDVTRALVLTSVEVPLEFPDSKLSIKALSAKKSYYLREPVQVMRARIIRVRPIFHTWQISDVFDLQEEIMDIRDVQLIIKKAGKSVGLGDARILGYGRFEASITRAPLP